MFLMDGEVTGKIKCTMSNWTGVIYKIPRIHLGDLKTRTELKQSGIYFLLGYDDNKKNRSPILDRPLIGKMEKEY